MSNANQNNQADINKSSIRPITSTLIVGSPEAAKYIRDKLILQANENGIKTTCAAGEDSMNIELIKDALGNLSDNEVLITAIESICDLDEVYGKEETDKIICRFEQTITCAASKVEDRVRIGYLYNRRNSETADVQILNIDLSFGRKLEVPPCIKNGVVVSNPPCISGTLPITLTY